MMSTRKDLLVAALAACLFPVAQGQERSPRHVPVQAGKTRAVGAFLRVTKDLLDALDIVVETGNGSGSVNYLIDVNGYWQWRP